MGRPKGSKNGVRQTVTVTCQYCGAAFEVPPHREKTAKFCGYTCRNRDRWMGEKNPNYRGNRGPDNPRWNGGPLSKTCEFCGTVFTVIRAKYDSQRCCSRECAWKLRRQEAGYDGPTKRSNRRETCKTCGKPLNRNQKTYCGWECVGTDLRKGETKTCPICGKEEYVKPAKLKHWRTCSRECDRRLKIETGVFAGENNPAWRGGYQNYYGPNWKRQRNAARKRDGYMCRMCGIAEGGQEHDVHHIIAFREFGYVPDDNDKYKLANRLSNLVTLCRSCHISVENGAELKLAD